MSNATKAQAKASEAYAEAVDKRVDSELADAHNAQRQSFWKDQKSRRVLGDVLTYVLLTVLGIIWLLPIVWIFLESFNKNTAPFTDTFFPTQYSFDSYITLFTQRNVLDFPRMFMNTFIIAVFTCIISVFFVLSVAYVMSRMRFHGRRFFMNFVLILGMFPGIMSVVAIYFILKAMGLTGDGTTILALILVYSAGTGAGFYVMKGYMDTIPTSLDEAAMLDGCTRWQVFWIIIVPICRPMIVYWHDRRLPDPMARLRHGEGDRPHLRELHGFPACGSCSTRSTSTTGSVASRRPRCSSRSRSRFCSS